MPRLVPDLLPGEEIIGEIDRHASPYLVGGASASVVPLAANLTSLTTPKGLFWALLVPAWLLIASLAMAKHRIYYLTTQRIVCVTPFAERGVKLEELDVVTLRDHFLGAPAVPHPFGTTLTFRTRARRFLGGMRISYVRNPKTVLAAIQDAVHAREAYLAMLDNRIVRVPRAAKA